MFEKAWENGAVPVPDALDRAFGLVDSGLKKAEIVYPGATCVTAFARISGDKVDRAGVRGRGLCGSVC